MTTYPSKYLNKLITIVVKAYYTLNLITVGHLENEKITEMDLLGSNLVAAKGFAF